LIPRLPKTNPEAFFTSGKGTTDYLPTIVKGLAMFFQNTPCDRLKGTILKKDAQA